MTGFLIGLALGLSCVVVYDRATEAWRRRALRWFEGAKQSVDRFNAEREQWKSDVTKLLDDVREDLRKVGWNERAQQATKLMQDCERIQ